MVTKTAFQIEELTPLVRRADGRLTPATPGEMVSLGYPSFTPGPGGTQPTIPEPPKASWMDREDLVPGLKNSTVVFGAGAMALVIAFLAMKQKQVVG